jgi:NAD(P)-dependent dehydrogenase (short-subunit alcohol dehydrogenase family)
VLAELKTQSPAVPVTFIPCDLTSLASVQEGAQKVIAETDRLDVLICNAGIMAVPDGVTKEGYEIQFGTNHVGHSLFIKLLLPLMQKTLKLPDADVRILQLSSEGHAVGPKEGIVFDTLKSADAPLGGPLGATWSRYGQSKLANIFYASELAKHYPDIICLSIHPGVVSTSLVGNLGPLFKALVYVTSWWEMKTPREGAFNQTWAATSDRSKLVNGSYYTPVGVIKKVDKYDQKLPGELWEWTEKELAPYAA